MPSKYIQRMFNLEPRDFKIIVRTANERGFGPKGHSAALRFILRDWELIRSRYEKLPFLLEGRLSKSKPDKNSTE